MSDTVEEIVSECQGFIDKGNNLIVVNVGSEFAPATGSDMKRITNALKDLSDKGSKILVVPHGGKFFTFISDVSFFEENSDILVEVTDPYDGKEIPDKYDWNDFLSQIKRKADEKGIRLIVTPYRQAIRCHITYATDQDLNQRKMLEDFMNENDLCEKFEEFKKNRESI